MAGTWAEWLELYQDPRVPSSEVDAALGRMLEDRNPDALEYVRSKRSPTHASYGKAYASSASSMGGRVDVASVEGATKLPFSGLWRPPKEA